MIQIDHLDHLVLTVKDIQVTCQFYQQVLGMEIVQFAGNRYALKFGNQKINLHEVGNELDPKAAHPTPGSSDLCFITSTAIERVVEHLNAENIPIVLGPVTKTGAQHPLVSVYFYDPDSNLIEVSNEKP